ncbi:DUF4303 domain-containing protein [Cellulomonas sp. S1-8]|uniref:DUF4303 domain-containing protein n=1 Tax=Cellulomonas sp. S1-8 TaxID=2904790 RepID=UPI002242CB50|nr:DUF4303 domain-containing protein [Cellulomonas sp. S1-8]UZN01631.1 DUF4303 domain-containing protein [Cellulomonas sp. S1-8]
MTQQVGAQHEPVDRPDADPDLVVRIASATRHAVEDLHAGHPGPFCVYALLTTGEALRPYLAVTLDGPERWDLPDSPFAVTGDEHLATLDTVYGRRGDLADLPPAVAETEYQVRLASMEGALRVLDGEGLFGTGAARDRVLLLVSPMPPDASDAGFARRLNASGALLDTWLAEASEGGD